MAAGISARRLRALDLHAPFHGVRRPSIVPDDLEWLCRAYLERMQPGAVFSHVTAAGLYRLPLPLYLRADTRVHVTVQSGRHPPYGRGVSGHELADDRFRASEIVYRDLVNGQLFALPVVGPAVLLGQLAPVLDPMDLVSLGDALVSGERPLATLADLRAMAEAWSGRRGTTALMSAIPRIRRGPLSRPESLIRLMIVAAGMPEPELNVRIEDYAGLPIATADLSWPEYRVLVEYEGDWHRTSAGKFRSDITRMEHYADAGWFGLRAHGDDLVTDPNPFLERLARRLMNRGWRPERGELRHVVAARP